MNEVRSFLFEDFGIRGSVLRLTETWQQIVAQHVYPNEVRALLGQGVAATVLLANSLKGQPRISIQLQGQGPLRLLLIQSAPNLAVRGMAQWRPYAEGDALLGEGRLAVILDTGDKHGIYQGIVPLVSSELDTCLEAYFAQSEQLSTRLLLESEADRVGGMMLQLLPGRDQDQERFEELAALARRVTADALISEPAETLLPRLFSDYTIRLFKPHPVLHDCRCTPDHLAAIARMLGEDELATILADEGAVELTCEFCNRAFRYDADDVESILRGETPAAVVH